MNYSDLKAEISDARYDGLDAAAIADRLNEKTVTAYRSIGISEIARYLFLNDLLIPLRAAATANNPEAITIFAALEYFESLETSDSDVRAKVDAICAALVAAQIIDEKNRDDINAMAITKVSRAVELGWPGGIVTNQDIAAARAR